MEEKKKQVIKDAVANVTDQITDALIECIEENEAAFKAVSKDINKDALGFWKGQFTEGLTKTLKSRLQLVPKP